LSKLRSRASWRAARVTRADAAERGKQMRFLMARGFGAEAIRRVIGGSEED
jgi:regulatory protein